MGISLAIQRLNCLLPLAERQQQLPADLQILHRRILRSFIEQGRPLSSEQLAEQLGKEASQQSVIRLKQQDLIVVNLAGEVVGAYPMTIEPTPHRITINGFNINAMCALDAIAVASMFRVEIEIDSRCHITQRAIRLQLNDRAVIAAEPNEAIHVGIRWQSPHSCAAHSLCREMVFLANGEIAAKWRTEAPEDISIYTLDEAIEFAAGFFVPLMQD